MADDLAELDRNALQRCMDIAMRDPDRAEQLTGKLDDGEPWVDVALTAAYGIQIRHLHLRPWQAPPCAADEDDPNERDKQAQKLLRRMLAAGISRFEPEPLKVLRAAKRRKACDPATT